MYFVYIPVNNEKYITEQKTKKITIIINRGLGGKMQRRREGIADNGFIACLVIPNPNPTQAFRETVKSVAFLLSDFMCSVSMMTIRVTVFFNRRGKTAAFLRGCWCM